MRKLLLVVVGLLLALPALSQTERGMVDHIDNHTSYTCNAARAGHRIWCLADGQEETCDGTSWNATASAGDIESVFDCLSGDCDAINAESGTPGSVLDFTDGGTLQANTANVQLIIPVDPSACNTEVTGTDGSICWDSTSDRFVVGTGASFEYILGTGREVLGDFFSPTNGELDIIDAVSNSGIDFGNYDLSTANTYGLVLPGNPTNCGTGSYGDNEGQVCWDRNEDQLWIGTVDGGSAGTQVMVGGRTATSHGTAMWGKDDGAANTFDTGTEVCAAAGLSCARTVSTAGVEADCANDYAAAYFHVFCY